MTLRMCCVVSGDVQLKWIKKEQRKFNKREKKVKNRIRLKCVSECAYDIWFSLLIRTVYLYPFFIFRLNLVMYKRLFQ